MKVGDEDVHENWDEIDDVGLNTKLNKLKKDTIGMNFPQQNGGGASGTGPASNMMLVATDVDDAYQSHFTTSSAAQPKLKILRRPTQAQNDKSQADARPKLPHKSLQQREQEYAQARLRILGSAKSPDDEQEAPDTSKMNRIDGYVIETMNTSNPPPSSRSRPAMNSTNQCPSPYPSVNGFQKATPRPNENLVRLPRGPDGTQGFTMQR